MELLVGAGCEMASNDMSEKTIEINSVFIVVFFIGKYYDL
jgi:hypothetical protein